MPRLPEDRHQVGPALSLGLVLISTTAVAFVHQGVCYWTENITPCSKRTGWLYHHPLLTWEYLIPTAMFVAAFLGFGASDSLHIPRWLPSTLLWTGMLVVVYSWVVRT